MKSEYAFGIFLIIIHIIMVAVVICMYPLQSLFAAIIFNEICL